MSLLVSNIQNFSLYDGPGIRTTVFLKGCSVRCPWCSNPENMIGEIQWEYEAKQCPCQEAECSINSYCSVDKAEKMAGKIVQEDTITCMAGALRQIGKYYTSKELYEEIISDRFFWKGTAGGVTFSGGEPLLQLANERELLKLLNVDQINVVVETSLFVETEKLQAVIDYVDLFYVDFKVMDELQCRTYLGGDIPKFKRNLAILKNSGKPFIARIPLVFPYTAQAENIQNCIKLMQIYMPDKVEIFSVHNLGAEKYKFLGMEYQVFAEISEEQLIEIRAYLEKDLELEVEILTI